MQDKLFAPRKLNGTIFNESFPVKISREESLTLLQTNLLWKIMIL